MESPRITIVAAIGAETRALGKGNDLLWRIGPDMARFKKLTGGHAVIMGRRTFDSIGKALPGRTNIVITENPFWDAPEVIVAHSLDEALTRAKKLEMEEVFVIGGAQIYAQVLRYADRLYLTLVEDDTPGDAYFPDYSMFTTTLEKQTGEHGGLRYTFLTLERGM